VNSASLGLSSTSRISMARPSLVFIRRVLHTGDLRDGKEKSRALARLRFDPNAPAVAFDDLFADGQPNAGAGILLAGVQALENLENPLGILRLDADAVVAHGKEPAAGLLLDTDVDFRRALAAELESVADQVLKQLHDLRGVHRQARQGIAGHG